jgi:hypothetical protein
VSGYLFCRPGARSPETVPTRDKSEPREPLGFGFDETNGSFVDRFLGLDFGLIDFGLMYPRGLEAPRLVAPNA